jgi:hypothetical protein
LNQSEKQLKSAERVRIDQQPAAGHPRIAEKPGCAPEFLQNDLERLLFSAQAVGGNSTLDPSGVWRTAAGEGPPAKLRSFR